MHDRTSLSIMAPGRGAATLHLVQLLAQSGDFVDVDQTIAIFENEEGERYPLIAPRRGVIEWAPNLEQASPGEPVALYRSYTEADATRGVRRAVIVWGDAPREDRIHLSGPPQAPLERDFDIPFLDGRYLEPVPPIEGAATPPPIRSHASSNQCGWKTVVLVIGCGVLLGLLIGTWWLSRRDDAPHDRAAQSLSREVTGHGIHPTGNPISVTIRVVEEDE